MIVVVGGRGQLGSELIKTLQRDAIALGHENVELTDEDTVRTALDRSNATAVINCAAYNRVDQAETEPTAAFAVNAFGPLYLARWCATRDVPLLHVSTDHVFGVDASRAVPYVEDDPPGPVSVYGNSKAAGEAFVRAACVKHYLVRTCGLYGHQASRSKGNFVATMLRLGAERAEVRVVGDQRCTPTSTSDLAQQIAKLIATDNYGTYHATNSGDCTWAEFATAVFDLAGLDCRVTPISTAEYGAAARRPAYSVLNCERIAKATGLELPHWRTALASDIAARAGTRDSQR